LRNGAADEAHCSGLSDCRKPSRADRRTKRLAVGREGILEIPDSKRNRKVFHKSLSLLWIASVEYCR
jgi:hypothetical protein